MIAGFNVKNVKEELCNVNGLLYQLNNVLLNVNELQVWQDYNTGSAQILASLFPPWSSWRGGAPQVMVPHYPGRSQAPALCPSLPSLPASRSSGRHVSGGEIKQRQLVSFCKYYNTTYLQSTFS